MADVRELDREHRETRSRARQHADRARRETTERRERESGVTGWVADRAGDWSLDERDWTFIERQKYFWNPLLDYWFRMEVSGWERIPEPPALVVGIHSGAPFPWDAWAVGIQWWRHFGTDRPLHGTAHDALMAFPVIGAYFRKMGVVPAAPDSVTTALAAGRDVVLYPGGERDSLREWTKRDEAHLAGRTGFVKLAIDTGVPIVPVATVGGPDAMPVLANGRRFAKLLRLDRVARLKMFPVALQAPWASRPRCCRRSRCRRRSARRSGNRSRWGGIRPASTIESTSKRSTRRFAAASRAAWTRSRDGGGSRCWAERAAGIIASRVG